MKNSVNQPPVTLDQRIAGLTTEIARIKKIIPYVAAFAARRGLGSLIKQHQTEILNIRRERIIGII